ncbi:MAG: MotA/TolQ/ExbB proton channel family protein [Nevskiaceae bacterium]
MIDFLLAPFNAVADLVESGGVAVEWIFLSCVLMWTITIERWYFFKNKLPVEAQAMLAQWRARQDHQSWAAHQIRRAMISRLNVAMNANLGILRVLVPLCPLLGLLGTVTGMLEVFDSMAARGSADARAMASGVSQAMVCTMTGLAVSVSGIYPVFLFTHKTKHETELLSDKFTF